MNFQLESDGEEKKKTGAADPSKSTFSFQGSGTADSAYVEEDDKPDTVFIADRYRSANTNAPSSTIEKTTKPKSSFGNTPIFFYIHALLLIAGIFMMGLSLLKSNDSMLTIGYIMTGVASGFAIVDAIFMKIHGGSISVLIWAIFFPPIYWFVRCRANGDSALIACVILLFFLGGIAFYIKGAKEMVSGIPGVNQPETTTVTYTDTNGNPVTVTYAVKPEDVDAQIEEALENINRRYYSEANGDYYIGRMIEDNVTELSCVYIPEESMTPAYLKITGRTNITGKDQKIEIDYYVDNPKVRTIRIGFKTYSREYDVFEMMMPTTTPNVEGNIQMTE